MRVLCISVEDAAQNRGRIFRRAQEIGLRDLEFFDAVHWKSLAPEKILELALHWTNKRRSLDIACTLSHRECWKLIANANQPMLIIEDDIAMSPKLPGILHEIESRLCEPNAFELYNLEYGPRKHLLRRNPTWSAAVRQFNPLSELFELTKDSVEARRLYHKKGGTAAYVLSPASASRLYESTVGKYVDMSWVFYRAWMTMHHVEPTPAAQLHVVGCPERWAQIDQLGDSRIGPIVGNDNTSLKSRLKRLRLVLDYIPQIAVGLTQGSYRSLDTDLEIHFDC